MSRIMLTTNDKFKCDECGEFIPPQDIIEGRATHCLITPDSHWTSETYETLCEQHYEKM